MEASTGASSLDNESFATDSGNAKWPLTKCVMLTDVCCEEINRPSIDPTALTMSVTTAEQRCRCCSVEISGLLLSRVIELVRPAIRIVARLIENKGSCNDDAVES
jgi:hypothetical protein